MTRARKIFASVLFSVAVAGSAFLPAQGPLTAVCTDASAPVCQAVRGDRSEGWLPQTRSEVMARNGIVTNERAQPVTDYTVLAFSVDSMFWRPLSRHISVARPDQTGKFQIRGLPPGAYYLAPVDPAEQGEWFEPAFLDQHRVGAARVTLGEGDVKTQDFKITTR